MVENKLDPFFFFWIGEMVKRTGRTKEVHIN